MLALTNVPSTAFVAHQRWGTQPLAHDLSWGVDFAPFVGGTAVGKLQGATTYATYQMTGAIGPAPPFVPSSATNGVSFAGGSIVSKLTFGDWDNGISCMSDGPWINKADEGGASTGGVFNYGILYYYLPYYTAGNGSTTMGPGIFSPNREVPSPVTFGSLPTGVPAGSPAPPPKPWQTLLFRPGAVINHPGAGQPLVQPAGAQPPLPPYKVLPDHLLLDLFWMPVAEPYAISEPFSTAGKVNLNYQILPFGLVSAGSGNPATSGSIPYMRRDTALRSAMVSLKIAGIPVSSGTLYKSLAQYGAWNGWDGSGFAGDPPNSGNNTARMPIDVSQTLQQFDATFNAGSIFQSASQICDCYLVPAGYTLANFAGPAGGAGSWYGNDFGLVGDNVRERPYADIYSRITTKSNTFTVFFTVQALKNSPASPPGQWSEATGSVVGEYRGSVDLERYLQQSNSIPDYLDNLSTSGTTSLEPNYRWRVLENNQFAP